MINRITALSILLSIPSFAGWPLIRTYAVDPSGGIWDDSPDIAIVDQLSPCCNGMPQKIFPAGVPAAADWEALPALSSSWEQSHRDPKLSRYHFLKVRICNPYSTPTSPGETLSIAWTRSSFSLDGAEFSCLDVCPDSAVSIGGLVTSPRKDARMMSDTEWQQFADAFEALMDANNGARWNENESGHALLRVAESLRALYATIPKDEIPHSARMLPVIRESLNRFEALLQEYDPCLKLPFWNLRDNPESAGAMGLLPLLGNGQSRLGPRIGVATIAGRNLRRGSCHSPATWPATPYFTDAEERALLSTADYASFCRALDLHVAEIFRAIGGDANHWSQSANDPLFYLMMAGIDRLWARWQVYQPHTEYPTRRAPVIGYDHFHQGDCAFGQMAEHRLGVNMPPWLTIAGSPWPSRLSRLPAADLWTSSAMDIDKLPISGSIVIPPVYEGAPCIIPVLKPYESVIMVLPFLAPRESEILYGNSEDPEAEPGDCHGPDWFCFRASIHRDTVIDPALPSNWQGTIMPGTPASTHNVFDEVASSNRRRSGTSTINNTAPALPLRNNGPSIAPGTNIPYFPNIPGGESITFPEQLVENPDSVMKNIYLRYEERDTPATGQLISNGRLLHVRMSPALASHVDFSGSSGIVPVPGVPNTWQLSNPSSASIKFSLLPPHFRGSMHLRLFVPEGESSGEMHRAVFTLGRNPEPPLDPIGGQHYEFDLRHKTLIPKNSSNWYSYDGNASPPPIFPTGWDGPVATGTATLTSPQGILSPAATSWHFHHQFSISPTELPKLEQGKMHLQIKAYDAFIVRINGIVVASSNMGENSLPIGSPVLTPPVEQAASIVPDNLIENVHTFTFTPPPLATGTNAMTVTTYSSSLTLPRRSGLVNALLNYQYAQVANPAISPNALNQPSPTPVFYKAPSSPLTINAWHSGVGNNGWTASSSASVFLNGVSQGSVTIPATGLTSHIISLPSTPGIYRITVGVTESKSGYLNRMLSQCDSFVIVYPSPMPRVSVTHPTSGSVIPRLASLSPTAQLQGHALGATVDPSWTGTNVFLWRNDVIGSIRQTLTWGQTFTPYWGEWSLIADAENLSTAQSAMSAPRRFVADSHGALRINGTTLTWDTHPDACLESSTDLNEWIPVPSASSPYSITPSVPRKFWRLIAE